MAPIFLDPSLLRRRAVLEAPDPVPDGMGGAKPAWREVRELSVHLEPVQARSRERFGREEAIVTHRVVCRHSEEVLAGRAFRFGTRRLVITTVLDPDERGRFLVCRCEEESG